MRKALGGKLCDTARAKLVCTFESDFGWFDLEFEKTELYRTSRGAWFLAALEGQPPGGQSNLDVVRGVVEVDLSQSLRKKRGSS